MRWVTLALALAVGASGIAAEEADVAALVEQLGHPEYAQRVDAQRRLETVGLDAFDALRAAQDDPDPEVASASRRLLAEAASSWGEPTDPPLVRRWLEAYDAQLAGRDLDIVAALAEMPIGMAAPALVRVARFAPSEEAAAEAARALLASSQRVVPARHSEPVAASIAALTAKHGPGSRPSAMWLALFADELLNEPQPARWRVFAEGERAKLAGKGELPEAVVATLHWCWLRSALAAGDDAEAAAAGDALVKLDDDGANVRLVRALRWGAEAQRFGAVDALIDRHAERLATKRGLYVRALAASLRGEADEAERLAAEGLAADEPDAGSVDGVPIGPGVVVASELVEWGRPEWAIAEYRAAPATDDLLDGEAAVATWRLANLLFDSERYAEAATSLSPLVAKLESSRQTRNAYDNLPQVQRTPPLAASSGELIARQKFSEALAARDSGDRNAELAALRRAIAAEPRDADVLIAMHRVVDAPEPFVTETRRRIDERRRDFEREVWENPDQADVYNQWAWLVANTYGDFDKAVRYSQRSLEIAPETAGYLDTLGRCLFAAGRLEEAVETQRRAVELEPQMLVLRRQLVEFEAALANPPLAEPSTEIKP